MAIVWDDPRRIAARAARAVADERLQRNLNHSADHERAGRRAMEEALPWEEMRERARAMRADAVRHLPELLDQLERNLTAAGGRVHRAAGAADAAATVASICADAGAELVVKGKSMATEEIGLNAELERRGITPVETDLGEYIVQQRGEHPSHILAPAVHLDASQVAELFTRLGGEPLSGDRPEELLQFARRTLRAKFLEAGAGVSGANFAVAATGTLIVVESEGNIRMCTSLPRVHVAVMGVEKVVRDWEAAAHLVQMLPLAAHGNRMATNASFLTGPRRPGDADGPQELHLVLVDNGRLAIRGTEFEEILHCIRCGACVAACPVYRQVGGHTYGSSYSGPIGAVVSPLLEGMEHGSGALAQLSSLCGACAEVCPVKIPLDDQLIMVRGQAAERDPRRGERALFRTWARMWARPAAYRATAATGGRAFAPLARRAAGTGRDAEGREWVARAPFPLSRWTGGRDLRPPAAKPFHQRWKERRG